MSWFIYILRCNTQGYTYRARSFWTTKIRSCLLDVSFQLQDLLGDKTFFNRMTEMESSKNNFQSRLSKKVFAQCIAPDLDPRINLWLHLVVQVRLTKCGVGLKSWNLLTKNKKYKSSHNFFFNNYLSELL